MSDFSNPRSLVPARVVAFQLMPMPSIQVVSIYVPDLPAAIAFYRDALGFTVEAEFGPEIVQLRHDGLAFILCACATATRPAYPSAAQVVPGLRTADAAADLERLRRLGVELVFDRLQPFPLGVFVAVRDPGGNVVELLQFTR